MEANMSLAAQASVPIPPSGVQMTCHVAVWFWAAQEAQRIGLTAAKSPLATLQRIGAMANGPQRAMMNLPHVGAVNFAGVNPPNLPPIGTVLRWNSLPTHSAIVTGGDAITGYNQAAFLPGVVSAFRTTARRADFHPNHGLVYMIPEATVVQAAGLVFNL